MPTIRCSHVVEGHPASTNDANQITYQPAVLRSDPSTLVLIASERPGQCGSLMVVWPDRSIYRAVSFGGSSSSFRFEVDDIHFLEVTEGSSSIGEVPLYNQRHCLPSDRPISKRNKLAPPFACRSTSHSHRRVQKPTPQIKIFSGSPFFRLGSISSIIPVPCGSKSNPLSSRPTSLAGARFVA